MCMAHPHPLLLSLSPQGRSTMTEVSSYNIRHCLGENIATDEDCLILALPASDDDDEVAIECLLVAIETECNQESIDPNDTNRSSRRRGGILKKWWNKIFRGSVRDLDVNKQAKDDGSVTTLSTAVSSVDSIESMCSEKADIPLMQQRLEQAGIPKENIEFVTDKVSKEVAHLYRNDEDDDTPANVIHVKTGVWKVTPFTDDALDESSAYYIVTGVRMEDRVDTKRLIRLLNYPKGSRKPKLVMAPQDIAESLTGYVSGTMAPICHSTPMPLVLDEQVVLPGRRLWMGSGIFGQCLSISVEDCMNVARQNPQGYQVGAITQRKKKGNPSS